MAALEGVWNILPTPFDDADALDLPSLAALVEFVLGTGVDGITILGVLGEAAKLSDAERMTVMAKVTDQCRGRVPICVGVSAPSTARSIHYAREASRHGALAVLLSPPPLPRPNDTTVKRHYLDVAAAVELPIVVQDHPASSGTWLSVELLLALATESPSLRTIKLEEEPSAPKIRQLLAADPRIRILGGLGGEMLLEELGSGAVGTMTGFSFPEILVDVVRRFRSGDLTGASEVFFRYSPLLRFENQAQINLAIRKYVYRRRGAIASAMVRRPGPTLDAGTIADLEALISWLGLDSGMLGAQHVG